MKKWLRFISLTMSALLLCANMHAISARAANLDGANAAKIANAITSTAVQKAARQGKDYFKTLANGRIIYVKGFKVTNLDRPVHGQILDTSATVTADSGMSWEVPVIWVDQNGNLLKVALEIEGVVKCYPLIAFYLPEGYAMAQGSNVSYDVWLPDFVTDLMAKTGVATLSNPSSGVTYITPLLPGKNKVEAKPTPQYYAYDEEVEYEYKPSEEAGKPYVPEEQQAGGNKGGGGKKKGANDYTSRPKISDKEKEELVTVHAKGDAETVFSGNEEAGIPDQSDELAWFIKFIKNVVEPEAVALLEQKFPAYKDAVKEGKQLGENLGLYVTFTKSGQSGTSTDTESDTGTNEEQENGAIAKLEWEHDGNGGIEYRLVVDASYFYKLDTNTGTYVFSTETGDGSDAYSLLDNTMVHELMHAHMLDYTRTGMTGIKYDEDTKAYKEDDSLKYPKWFTEGIATAVDNPYQYRNNDFISKYGYDAGSDTYSVDSMVQSYSSNSQMQLANADGGNEMAMYSSGYLATVYLSYLAAKAYDDKDAIKTNKKNDTYTIDSKVIVSGMNHILENLHDGYSLDKLIGEISQKITEKEKRDYNYYSNTDDFMNKFLTSKDQEDCDNGSSADFCAKLLNYFAANSDEKGTVNGSILLDFTSTDEYQLNKSLKKGKQKAYVLEDEIEASTADVKTALESGGKSDVNSGGSTSEEETTQDEGEDAAAKPAAENKAPNTTTPSTDENVSENQDSSSQGGSVDKPSDNSEDNKSEEKPSKGDKNKKEKSDETEESASESSSEETEPEETDPEETAEFPAEDSDPEPEPEPQQPEQPQPPAEEVTAPEETPAPEPEVTPEPEPAPQEDYTPPGLIISESEPEPSPEEQPNQDNNQEVLDAVKPEPESNDDGPAPEASGE